MSVAGRIAFIALLLALVVTILYGTLIGVFKNDQDGTNSGIYAVLAQIEDNLTAVNDTLTNSVDQILETLSSTNTSLISDITAAIVQLNDTLCTKIMQGDAVLQQNINTVNGTLLYSINSVTGDVVNRNIDLVANGTGIAVQPDPLSNRVALENTGVVTINGVASLPGSSNFLVTGTGMIAINSYPLTSTVEVDGTALSTAITNLQMQTNMQQMEIAVLNTNVTDLQTQITNIQLAENTISQALNGTTIELNMTIMELLTDITTLQSQVATLMMQVAALQSAAVPAGTIVPFGGTVVPSGYLACDGTEYMTADYPALYTVVGTMYCPGPCTNMSMFAVPDLRGKVPAGQGGTALSGAIGSTAGAETHTLSTTEMPSHGHTGTTNNDGSHGHTWWVHAGTGGHSSPGPGVACNANAPFGGLQVNDIGSISCGDSYINEYWTGLQTNQDITFGNYPPSSPVHQHGFTTNNAGSGQAHNNVQPSLIVKYIIKT